MSLDRLRTAYESDGLELADLDVDPISQFGQWYEALVAAGYFEPEAMVLATIDAGGWPDARAVLMKGYDPDGWVFFTNYASTKARAIEATGRAALLFAWVEVRRQVRIVGTIERVSEAESDEYFATRPRGSRIGAWASLQSTPLGSRAELDERFEDVARRFSGSDIERPPHWGGYRVRPDHVEFWQGRPSRLHDRFVYRRHASGWEIIRLHP
jgi:pyridoxamine 5'-phosphate oxidase